MSQARTPVKTKMTKAERIARERAAMAQARAESVPHVAPLAGPFRSRNSGLHPATVRLRVSSAARRRRQPSKRPKNSTHRPSRRMRRPRGKKKRLLQPRQALDAEQPSLLSAPPTNPNPNPKQFDHNVSPCLGAPRQPPPH